MDISDIDVPLLAEHVRKLAEAEPHTTAVCRYFNLETGEAVCIVGQAMALQGVTPDDFEMGVAANGEYIATVLEGFGDEYAATIEWLGAVQYRQDGAYRWADAVEWADTDNTRPEW